MFNRILYTFDLLPIYIISKARIYKKKNIIQEFIAKAPKAT